MRKLTGLSKYWSEDEGRRVVEAWRRSGENPTVFARRHGLNAKRIVYWNKRLAADASGSVATVSFVPAEVVAADEVAAVVCERAG